MAEEKLSVRQWLMAGVGLVMIIGYGGRLLGLFDSDASASASSVSSSLESLIPKSDPAEQAAVVIKDGLRSPDSFEYVGGKVIWQGIHKGDAAYVALVSYNAQNGFGALLRGCAIVAFSITQDDQVSWNGLHGMRETERTVCEHSGDRAELSDLAKTVADMNFSDEK